MNPDALLSSKPVNPVQNPAQMFTFPRVTCKVNHERNTFLIRPVISGQMGQRGTVTEAAGFDPEADVKRLREAMKGAGEFFSHVGPCHYARASVGK